MTTHPDELEVRWGELDTGMRVQNPLGTQTEPPRGPARLLAAGATLVLALVIAVFWVAHSGSDPSQAEPTGRSASTSPKTGGGGKVEPKSGWGQAQAAGWEMTKLVFMWAIPCVAVGGSALKLHERRQKNRIAQEIAEVEVRKRKMIAPNQRGQWAASLDFIEGNPHVPVDANNRQLDVQWEDAHRAIVSRVHTYHVGGPGGGANDPLADELAVPIKPVTFLDMYREGYVCREAFCAGMGEDGPIRIPWEDLGGYIIGGRPRKGKTVGQLNVVGNLLGAGGTGIVIDLDKHHPDGLGRRMGPELCDLLALPPAKEPDEILHVVEFVMGRFEENTRTGAQDFFGVWIEEWTSFQDQPDEVKDPVMEMVRTIMVRGAKRGMFMGIGAHDWSVAASGGRHVRPQANTAFLFDMETSQARMMIGRRGEPLPETDGLPKGVCWLKTSEGLFRVRVPMINTPADLPEIADIARRARGEAGPARIVYPDELARPPAPTLTEGLRVVTGVDRLAIESAEPPPDPKYPGITVDSILQTYFTGKNAEGLPLTRREMVQRLWPENCWDGGNLTRKGDIIDKTVRKYAHYEPGQRGA